MKTDFKAFAQFYYSMGFNVSCITNYNTPYNMKEGKRFKRPYHPSLHLFDSRQSIDELNNYDWENAIGLGTFTGGSLGKEGDHFLFALDIDGINYQELLKVLSILKIPRNYEWVVKSGSGLGYHIYMLVEGNVKSIYSIFRDNIAYGRQEYTYKSILADDDTFDCPVYFNKIEFLAKAHIILPPSMHGSTFDYEFVNCHQPSELPIIVHFGHIWNLRSEICKRVTEPSYIYYPESNSDIIKDNKYDSKLKYIVLDIETTGLIENSKFPNILQLAWYCLDKDYNILKRDSLAIKTNNRTTNNASDINKLDIDKLNLVGYEIREALKSLKFNIDSCDKVLCYNTDFDIKVLNHYYNLYFDGYKIDDKKTFCVMKHHSRISKNDTWMKLDDLYKNTFKGSAENIGTLSHNAEIDVYKTYQLLAHFNWQIDTLVT